MNDDLNLIPKKWEENVTLSPFNNEVLLGTGRRPWIWTKKMALEKRKKKSPLDVLHDAYAPCVAPPRDHAHVADLELDRLDRLARLKVHLDGVVDLFRKE